MNIVNAGTRYQIYGEELRTFSQLPVGSYEVCFNKMTGFFLTSHPDLLVKEEKIYGNSREKVSKVLRSYRGTDRNFGVILSGAKGIGKSLFVRVLSQEAIKKNIPVILVTAAIPGIEGFITSIEQDVMVIFDEFEKTFAAKEDWTPQDDLLSLFDGLDGGHKLFVVTCNDVNKISSYMLNRPGRFHYHFTLSNPSAEEVEEYMRDKLDSKYYDVIPRVVNASRMTDMTYDFLRAIAYEVNQGYSIEETMNDLNISRVDDAYFDIIYTAKNGLEYHAYNTHLNFSNKGHISWLWLYGAGKRGVQIGIDASTIKVVNNELAIPEDVLCEVEVEIDTDPFDDIEDDDKRERLIKEAKKEAAPTSIIFKRTSTSKTTRLAV